MADSSSFQGEDCPENSYNVASNIADQILTENKARQGRDVIPETEGTSGAHTPPPDLQRENDDASYHSDEGPPPIAAQSPAPAQADDLGEEVEQHDEHEQGGDHGLPAIAQCDDPAEELGSAPDLAEADENPQNDLYDAQYDSGDQGQPGIQNAEGTTGRVPHPYYGDDYDSDQPLMPPKRKRGRPRRVLDDGPVTQVKTEQTTKKSRRGAKNSGTRKKFSPDDQGTSRRGGRVRQRRTHRRSYADWSEEEEMAEMAYPVGLIRPPGYGGGGYRKISKRGAGKRAGIRPAGPGGFYSIIPVAPASKADRICPVCSRGPFKDWLRYHRHAMQHAPSRGRPYGCERCGHSFFRSKGQLNHHQRMLCGIKGEVEEEDEGGEGQQDNTATAGVSEATRDETNENASTSEAQTHDDQRSGDSKNTGGVKPSPLTRLLMQKAGMSAKAQAVATKQQNDAVLMPEIKRIQSEQRLMIRVGRKGRLATDVCPMCGRYFRDRDEHMKMHTADPSRPYQCSLCKMAYFETVRSAQRHLFWCSGGRRTKRCRGDIAEKRQQQLDTQQQQQPSCRASGTMITMPAGQPTAPPLLHRAPISADELMNSVLSLSGIATGPGQSNFPSKAPTLIQAAPLDVTGCNDMMEDECDIVGGVGDRNSPPQLTPMVSAAQIAGMPSQLSGGRSAAQGTVSRRRKERSGHIVQAFEEQPTMVQQQRHLPSACSSVPPPHMSPAPPQHQQQTLGMNLGQAQHHIDVAGLHSQGDSVLHNTARLHQQTHQQSSSNMQQQQQQQQHANNPSNPNTSHTYVPNTSSSANSVTANTSAAVQLQHLQQAVYNVGNFGGFVTAGGPLNVHAMNVAFDPSALWPSSNTAMSMMQQQTQTSSHNSIAANSQQSSNNQQQRIGNTFICDLCERAQFSDPQALNKHKEMCGLPRLMGKH